MDSVLDVMTDHSRSIGYDLLGMSSVLDLVCTVSTHMSHGFHIPRMELMVSITHPEEWAGRH